MNRNEFDFSALNGEEHNHESDLQAWLESQYQADYKRMMREAVQLLERRRGGEAIPLLEPLLRQEPNNLDVIVNLSSAYILEKQYGLAVELLERATTEIQPDDPILWSNLAAAYLGTLIIATPEKQLKALGAYERALMLDATFPNTHYNMGLIYVDRGEWDKADHAFANAIRVDPHDKDARLWRQRLAEKRNGASGNVEVDQSPLLN